MLYIAAIGRSGTTLAERMLGQLPGVCAIGEVVHLWQRGVVTSELCGCGEPFLRCSFWRDVGAVAFGGWDETEMMRVAQLRAAVDRTRFIPSLLAPGLRPSLRTKLAEYVSYYRRLYDAVSVVSGGQVVVDSSKHASLAFCLRSSQTIDLRVVHVVRDSRAVAHSWTRTVSRPEARTTSFMPVARPAGAAWQWNHQNGAIQLLASTGTPTLRVRYEDLVTAPERTLARIAAFGGLAVEADQLSFVGADERGRWADLNVAHTASGNPMRFQTGLIRIRRDDEWRAAMSTTQRRVVTALTLPLLTHYGYHVQGRPL